MDAKIYQEESARITAATAMFVILGYQPADVEFKMAAGQHDILYFLPGTLNPGFRSGDRKTVPRRIFLLADSLDFRLDKGEAVFIRQGIDHFPDIGSQAFRNVFFRVFVQNGVIFQIDRLFPAAIIIDDAVARDLVHPAFQLLPVADSCEVGVNPQEHILKDIFGIFLVRNSAPNEPAKPDVQVVPKLGDDNGITHAVCCSV